MWRRRPASARPHLDRQGWALPLWWRRRADPTSPAYDPVGEAGVNTVDRRWTLLGTIDGAGRGAVDPRGTVWTGGSFTIEWWVRANDRWYMAPQVSAVRQSAVDGTPVVETRMRAAGGDMVHRVGAVAGGAGHVRIEVDNETDAAVALAFAIRPFDLTAATSIEHIEFVDGWVVVDGVPALQLSRAPGLTLGGTAAADLAVQLDAPDVDGRELPPLPVRCDRGSAHAVLSVPVVHGTSIEAVAPLVSQEENLRLEVGATPPLERVAAGWVAQTRDETRVELPDDSWNRTLDLLRRSLVLFSSPDGATSRPMTGDGPVTEDHLVAEALDRLGRHRDAASGLLALRDLADRNGALGDVEATAAALHALDRHTVLSGVTATAEACADVVVGAARHLSRELERRRRDGAPESETTAIADGLASASSLLAAVGQADAAADLRRLADTGRSTTAVSAEAPAGPVHRIVPPMGFDVVATARAARADLAVGRDEALDRIDWLVDTVAPTGSLPALVHPAGGGVGGEGHDGGAVAATVTAMLSAAVVDHDGEARLSILPVARATWLGAPIEAHRLPTRWGVVSFAVRWHGERPALLWEVDEPAEGLVVDCPGFDPTWSTTEPVGETLLATPELHVPGDVGAAGADPADTAPAGSRQNEASGQNESSGQDEGSGPNEPALPAESTSAVEVTIDLDRPDGGFS